jgi:hypothetical protein
VSPPFFKNYSAHLVSGTNPYLRRVPNGHFFLGLESDGSHDHFSIPIGLNAIFSDCT